MLRNFVLIAGMTVAAVGISVSMGCGGGGTGGSGGGAGGQTTTGSTTSSSTDTSSGSAAGQPPGPGAAQAPDGTGNVTFAIRKLYLGDKDWDGNDPDNGWRNFGYNLDDKVSTATSTDLCKPRDGAKPKDVYPDGNDGIDNSFGRNILPVLTPLADVNATVNQAITDGTFTIMLDLQKLGSNADYNPMFAQLYAGADFGGPPKFDGSDQWPVRPELLQDPADKTNSKIQFPKSYLVGDTWVSGTKGTVNLSLTIAGYSLDLTISSAWITMNLDSSHKHATKGIIAGVIQTDALIASLQKIAGGIDPSFCDPANPTLVAITTQIGQASDMMADGSHDPSKTCDSISIGLGFDAELVELGPIAPPSPPPTSPCP